MPADPLPRLNDTHAFCEGITGGALGAVNEWWDARERPSRKPARSGAELTAGLQLGGRLAGDVGGGLGAQKRAEREEDQLRRRVAQFVHASLLDVVVQHLPDAAGDRLGGDRRGTSMSAGACSKPGCRYAVKACSAFSRISIASGLAPNVSTSVRCACAGSEQTYVHQRVHARRRSPVVPLGRRARRRPRTVTRSAWCRPTFCAPRKASCLVGYIS